MIIKTTKKNMGKTQNDADYEDSGLRLVDKPIVWIPRFLEDLMYEIDENKDVDDSAEFKIFVQAKIEGWSIELTEKYMIPVQYCHDAETDDTTTRPDLKWNTVIHKQPNGNHVFSGGDNIYINRNWDVSLIWTNARGFVKAQYNMYQKRKRLKIDCDYYIMRCVSADNIVGIDNIKKFQTKAKKGYVIEHDYGYEYGFGTTAVTTNGSGKIPTPDFKTANTDWIWDKAKSKWRYKGRLVVRDKKTHEWRYYNELSDTVIPDGEGNLVNLADAVTSSIDDDVPSDEKWIGEAISFFSARYKDPMIQIRAEEAVELLDICSTDYTKDHIEDAKDYHQLALILSYVSFFWGWDTSQYDNYVEHMAQDWVVGMFGYHVGRIKAMYEIVKSNEVKIV